MRILVISLLRLGDLILQRPLLVALRKRFPEGEIHLLLNKQFAQSEFLFAGLADRFIYFDRETLQKSCGEKEYNIFWGVHSLKETVAELNQAKYDFVYNFTHNRLSAHLAGLIHARQRLGIYSDRGVFFGLTNPWIQFFNNFFGRPEAEGFHYTEILAKAMGLSLPPPSASRRLPAGKRTLVLQPLTSDPKKNWGLQNHLALLTALQEQGGYEVKVLGAPFEEAALRKVFPSESLFICDLENAAALLQEASLLISGDTSIKHLAAHYDVPVLELSLGSSQPLQVGAYSNNAVILQPRVPCGPCPHSSPCSQIRHTCGEGLSVPSVFEAAGLLLSSRASAWEAFCLRNQDLNILKTEIHAHLGWTVQCLSLAQRDYFEKVMQKKTMIVEELNRRDHSDKGVSYEQRTGKLPLAGAEAP